MVPVVDVTSHTYMTLAFPLVTQPHIHFRQGMVLFHLTGIMAMCLHHALSPRHLCSLVALPAPLPSRLEPPGTDNLLETVSKPAQQGMLWVLWHVFLALSAPMEVWSPHHVQMESTPPVQAAQLLRTALIITPRPPALRDTTALFEVLHQFRVRLAVVALLDRQSLYSALLGISPLLEPVCAQCVL